MRNINTLLISFLLLLSINLSAQLTVESTGKVKVGNGSLRLESNSSDWGFIYMGDSHGKGLRFTPSGKMYLYTDDPTSFVTATSTTSQRNLIVMDPNGNYKFWEKGDGSVYSIDQYITSDSTKKENVLLITDAIEKVQQIKGVTYNLKEDSENTTTSLKEDIEREENTISSAEIIEKERNAGVFAQDVEKVLPEAVRTLEDGSKVVSYNDLVALLIEAIKEQQTQIKNLEEQVSDCCSSTNNNLKSTLIGSNETKTSIYRAKLYQNTPNPFSTQTTIRYEIPETVQFARLHICNISGTLLKTIDANQRGAGSVIIIANEFVAGMYLYSLVCDGKIVDTKQMLLTE